MTKQELVLYVAKLIVVIGALLVERYAIPFIKSKIGESDYNKVKGYVEEAVRCAQQVMESEEGEAKKEYVLEYVNSKVSQLGISISAEDIDVLIESAVKTMKIEEGK